MLTEILIKSFLRHDCLKRCVESIRKYYPDIVIRVCDDGNLKSMEGVNHLYKLPFYSGASVGRNYLISKVWSPYFVMLDDDMIFTEDTKLEKMIDVIKFFDDTAIVGGNYKVDGKVRDGFGELKVTYSENEGRRITRYYYGKYAPKITFVNIDVIPCRMTPHFYMGNKNLFGKYGIKYRDEMKRCEHYPFFLDLPKQVRCYGIQDVCVEHLKEIPTEYGKYKNNDIYHKMGFERKLKFEYMYQEGSVS